MLAYEFSSQSLVSDVSILKRKVYGAKGNLAEQVMKPVEEQVKISH